MSDNASEVHAVGVFVPENDPAAVAHRKLIWKTFGILLGITALEFIIAFTVPAGTLRLGIFIIMTLIKAFYIVAEFMHLRYEVRSLILSIAIPVVFILWLIIALITEGAYIFLSRPWFNN